MKVKRLSALFLTAAVTAAALNLPAMAAETAAPRTRAESAQQAIEAAMEYGGATSIQYALWEDGVITMTGHAGVYSKTEDRALTADTLYGIGSVSKIYTTAAVMQLMEAGKVQLDSPVTQYLPNFKMADERYRQITVRMLLNHASGLMGSSMGSGILFGDASQVAKDDLLNRLSTQRLKADPGAYSVYCNDGFTLAELVVEAVSGQDFTEYVHQHILEPNGLKATYTPADDFDRDLLAKIYYGTQTEALPTDTLGVYGTGGLYATSSDLAAFGGLFCGTELLTQASLDAMATAESDKGLWPADSQDDMLSYGLGWDSVRMYPFHHSGIQVLNKGGDTSFYHSALVVIPEYDLSVAVQSSGGVSLYNELAGARILLDTLAEQGVQVDENPVKLPESTPARPSEDERKKAGLYASSVLGQIQIDVSAEGVLTLNYLTSPGMPAQSFTYQADGTYRDESGQILVALVTEENGNTYFYEKSYGAIPKLTTTVTAEYTLQKLEDDTLPPEVEAAWQARGQRLYLAVNERYSSQAYAFSLPMAGVALDTKYPGYIVENRITGANLAESVLQIPGSGGRDCSDMVFYEEDGAEYLTYRGVVYMDLSAVKNLYVGTGSYCTIQEDGHARWFQVGALAGKTIQVQLPEHGAFYVYDANGLAVASSWQTGDTTAVLPEDGAIVFAGDPGARFHLTLAGE